MVHGSAAIAPQHAGRMRVVNHHDGAVFLRQVAQRGQRPNVAIHGKHAIGNDQLVPGLARNFLQQLFGMRCVFMTKNFDLRP